MNNLKLWLPLIVLVFISIIFIFGLEKDPTLIPSALINKKAPDFNLPSLNLKTGKFQNNVSYSPNYWDEKVWVINVFASWCVACNFEHPHLMKISLNHPNVELIGLAYKDKPEDTARWIKKNGNPYKKIIMDFSGRTGIDYGVYGVPETFIIDKKGLIKYKHIGPINEEFYSLYLSPILKKNN